MSAIFYGTESTAAVPQTLAVLAILVGEFASATNKVLAKHLTVSIPIPILLRDMGMIVAVFLGIAAVLFERHLPMEFTSTGVLAFVYLGLVASFAGSGLYLILLRRYAVSALGYLQFATAAVAAVAGTAVGGERIGAPLTAGIVTVLAGIFLLTHTANVS